MNQLYVINQTDLLNFGCPHCGGEDGGTFLSFGSCALWYCDNCATEIAIVQNSINEIFEFNIRNTNIRDCIGKHPYKQDCDCMFTVEEFLKQHPGFHTFNLKQVN